jgi:hypothetical protein
MVKERLEEFGLVPTDEALPRIRALLTQAVKKVKSEFSYDYLVLLHCVQLFNRGLVEDALLIWNAKHSGFGHSDASDAIDNQLLCGAGLEPTRQFLASRQADKAAVEALAFIERWPLDKVPLPRDKDPLAFSSPEKIWRLYQHRFAPMD